MKNDAEGDRLGMEGVWRDIAEIPVLPLIVNHGGPVWPEVVGDASAIAIDSGAVANAIEDPWDGVGREWEGDDATAEQEVSVGMQAMIGRCELEAGCNRFLTIGSARREGAADLEGGNDEAVIVFDKVCVVPAKGYAEVGVGSIVIVIQIGKPTEGIEFGGTVRSSSGLGKSGCREHCCDEWDEDE